MATDSSALAWRIPGTGEPGGLWVAQSQTRLKRLSSSSSCRVDGKSFVVVLYSGNLVQYNFICALFYFTFKRKPL